MLYLLRLEHINSGNKKQKIVNSRVYKKVKNQNKILSKLIKSLSNFIKHKI